MTKILIIDDNDDIRDGLRLILVKKQYETAIASNGREALEMIKKNPPNIVICDIFMPEIDGLEIISEIKRAHPAINIIVMSGGDPKGNKDLYLSTSIHMGASYTFRKPLVIGELLDAIKCLEG